MHRQDNMNTRGLGSSLAQGWLMAVEQKRREQERAEEERRKRETETRRETFLTEQEQNRRTYEQGQTAETRTYETGQARQERGRIGQGNIAMLKMWNIPINPNIDYANIPPAQIAQMIRDHQSKLSQDEQTKNEDMASRQLIKTVNPQFQFENRPYGFGEASQYAQNWRDVTKPPTTVPLPDPEEVRTKENYKMMADEILAEAKRRVSTSNTPAQEVDAVREQYDVDMISINNYNPEAYSNLVRELNALKIRGSQPNMQNVPSALETATKDRQTWMTPSKIQMPSQLLIPTGYGFGFPSYPKRF